jgi:hypothetical protein
MEEKTNNEPKQVVPTPKAVTPKAPVEHAGRVKKHALEGWEGTTELMMPVMSRLKKRADFLRKEGASKTIKIPMGANKYRFETIKANRRITNISPIYKDGKGFISYKVLKTDKDGNVVTTPATTQTADNGKELEVEKSHIEEKEVTETIEHRQPIMVEEFFY